ncbi:proline racemase [Mycena haematopus]|nr:proline racemase [Mycena haematopus]
MDVFETLLEHNPATRTIKVVDMHTSGEPTRIVVNGYPHLEGDTLLEMRRCARQKHDDIRQRLMREPRGHTEMYGAILIAETELTRRDEADIGVLFCHNGEGYSTMCGHATIALGRFLVDTHDLSIFPRRNVLPYDEVTGLTTLRLHAPCGVVHVSVYTDDGHSDATRPVSFLGVPSFVTARDLEVEIPLSEQWKRLRDSQRSHVKVDIAYGGAFYALVSAAELGFPDGVRGDARTLAEFDDATAALKRVLHPRKELYTHPSEPDLEYLYSVMVVERTLKGETGLCFFADQQIDRSPTGSCVMARVALAVDQGRLQIGEGCEYESIVSLLNDGTGFRGTAVEVVLKVAFYTGAASFVVEETDMMPNGFTIALPS